MQNDNYDNFTRLAFENSYSFPLNILMKQQRKKAILNHLDHIGYNSKEKVERIAKEIYEALSNKLGEKEFFFGDRYDHLLSSYLHISISPYLNIVWATYFRITSFLYIIL